MEQLGELRDLYDEFKDRKVAVIGVSNEERNLMAHTNVIGELGFLPEWDLVTDIGYRHNSFARTTAYLLDTDGVVRQVFPMEIYDRPPWWAILNEVDRIDAADKAAKKGSKRKASTRKKR